MNKNPVQKKRAMLAFYVKLVSPSSQGINGEYHRLRGVFGKEWVTAHVPKDLMPVGIKKGDFVSLRGNLACIKGESYLFADEIGEHIVLD